MKIPIDLLIFDFDGTLTDSIPSAIESIQDMIAELSYPRKSKEEIREHIGFGERALVSGSIGTENDLKVKAAQRVYYKFISFIGDDYPCFIFKKLQYLFYVRIE